MEKKVPVLKPDSLQEQALVEEEQRVLAEAKETAKRKAAKGAEVMAAKAAEDVKSKSKKAVKEGLKIKDDPKLAVDPKAKEQLQFEPFKQNVSALIKKATEGQLKAAFKQQTDLINSLKSQQEQFMAQQNQKQDSLQKRVSTMIGTIPVQPVLVEKSQNQVGQLLEAGRPEEDDEDDDFQLFEPDEQASDEEYDGEVYDEDEPIEVFDREKDKKLVPSEDQLERWRKARKLGPEFNDADWCKVGVKRLVEKLTGHGSCKPFQAMDADPEIPLAWPTDKDADIKMKECEVLAGAMGMASTKLMEKITEAVGACAINYQEFSDHRKVMEDPRFDAMMAIQDVQDCMIKELAPVAENLLKLSAATANKAVLFRRSLYQKGVKRSQKDRVSKMIPGNKRLFGGKLADMCKALKDGGQLSQLLHNNSPYKKKYKNRSNHNDDAVGRGRGGGNRGRGRGRGAYRSPGFKKDQH